MSDSISLLLMTLLSLQAGPTNAADKDAHMAKSASTRCAAVAPSAKTADADPACRNAAPPRERAVRVTIPSSTKARANVKPITLSASAR